jgi:hypothetical protein
MSPRLQPHQLAAYSAHQKLGLPIEGFVMPPPLPRKKRNNEEFRVQSTFAKMWRANCQRLGIAQCLAFHIPNGSVMGGGNAEWQKNERNIRGRLQKLAGVEDGVVDYFISVPSGQWHGMYIEFKGPKGTTSEAQDRFIGFATARGYKCEVHTDADVAWKSLLKYLKP